MGRRQENGSDRSRLAVVIVVVRTKIVAMANSNRRISNRGKEERRSRNRNHKEGLTLWVVLQEAQKWDLQHFKLSSSESLKFYRSNWRMIDIDERIRVFFLCIGTRLAKKPNPYLRLKKIQLTKVNQILWKIDYKSEILQISCNMSTIQWSFFFSISSWLTLKDNLYRSYRENI